MPNKNLLLYLQSQQWLFRTREDASLVFFSARQMGYRQYIGEWYGVAFADTVFMAPEKRLVSIFHEEHLAEFHEVSKKMIFADPFVLETWIEKYEESWKVIREDIAQLQHAVEEFDETLSVKIFQRMMQKYSQASAQLMVVFSLGTTLAENLDRFTGVNEIMNHHDILRNSIAIRDEKLGECIFHFLRFVLTRRTCTSTPVQSMNFLSLSELLAWLIDEKSFDIDAVVTRREKRGYVYLDLRELEERVIDETKSMKQIVEYFSKLYSSNRASENASENDDVSEFAGRTAFGEAKMSGEVIIVRDRIELDEKKSLLDGKILVTIQTTPYFIPYLKGILAIITDEGGITCHAAIVSRELNKPCIIGTKIATKVLRDGDLVEIDAEKGIVRKLN